VVGKKELLMITQTTKWGKSTIQIFNPNEPCKPIIIATLETYQDMIDDMNKYLKKIMILVDNGERVRTQDIINYQLHWIIDHFDMDLAVPLTMLFDDLVQYYNEREFNASIFEEMSDLDRPTKSCEAFLYIGNRLELYANGYIDADDMHRWVDSFFEEGEEEVVYCEK
jgi:hypothetical protein